MPNQTGQNQYRDALQNLLCCRPVAYYPSLARAVGGVHAAVMLSQLLYWSGTKAGSEFFKCGQELLTETGLSVKEQATARKRLIQCGAIIARRRGCPATWHYQVDLERISELLSSPQIRPTVESRFDQRENLPKGESRFDDRANHTEGAINELNTENTPENTNQEEEGPRVQISHLDDQIVDELLTFGVFKSKLPEIDQAGWSPDQLRELMTSCRRDDRRGTPAALLLKRIHELKPPISGYGYTQFNIPDNPDEPTSPSLYDLIDQAFDRALKPRLGGDYDSVMDKIDVAGLELKQDMADDSLDIQDLSLACPVFIWDRYIKPNSESILIALEPLGINSISLAA